MPALQGLNEQTYSVVQPHKTPSRVFIGHSDGVGSMRWDGQTWIDEGRLPNTVYEARAWSRIRKQLSGLVAATARCCTWRFSPRACEIQRCRFFPVTRVLSKGIPNVELVAGSIFVTFDRSKNIFRWDTAAKKFVIDNRFLLPIDAPDVTSFLGRSMIGTLGCDNIFRQPAVRSLYQAGQWNLARRRGSLSPPQPAQSLPESVF
jgi:hypothetical protein